MMGDTGKAFWLIIDELIEEEIGPFEDEAVRQYERLLAAQRFAHFLWHQYEKTFDE